MKTKISRKLSKKFLQTIAEHVCVCIHVIPIGVVELWFYGFWHAFKYFGILYFLREEESEWEREEKRKMMLW